MIGLGLAILFYGWHSLGEGLNLGEARDAMFTFSGVIAWVGKQAQLSTKPISLGDSRWLIAQAITKGHIKPKGAWPHSFHSTCVYTIHNSVIKTCPHDQLTPGDCQMMGGAPAWASGRTVGARLCAAVRPEPRSETTRVMGGSTPVIFTFIRSWI